MSNQSIEDLKDAFNPFDRFTQGPSKQERPMAWMYFDKQMQDEYNQQHPQHPIKWGCGICGTSHYNSLVMITALVMVCDGCYIGLSCNNS